ncbi:MAG TPA: hypothetical protein VF472_11790 [Burkholderiaceae bacterium]
MWLLPWEKLHPVILGPLLVLLGAILLFNAPYYSWDQLKAGLIFLFGVGLSVHGVKRIAVEMQQWGAESLRADAAKRIADASAPPDYAKYSEAQLRQVLTRIDKERFPERVAEIEARLLAIEKARKGFGA